ncbi:MAG: Endolytic murein transglycosylase [Nitrosomonadaceae bacterium]|nr:endolytic transglycosylase MltG [Nitrosospira sp.]MBI0413520.1 endolytic transglycosylase MltG [Nitrosospira sp.]MCG3773096.1 Endolytic murein transglycosylase [Nitrosomonadaceae bacterium]MSQ44733.1 endolytic transglycosylase MltG [Nitrosomonadaceae bacterium]GDX59797.1 lipoprotein [Nitrosomonadaceae bacterium]
MHILKRITLLALVAASLFVGWFAYHVQDPVQIPITPYELSIKPGSSLRTVAKQLVGAGALHDAWSFILLSRLMGYSSSLKAGDYELAESISPWQLLKRVTNGDVNQSEIRFIEGWTFSQLRKTLNENPALQHDTAGLTDFQVMQLIGASETMAEGLFSPDTYYFVRGNSDVAILKRAYHAMQNNLNTAWTGRATNLPLTDSYQALILASIVEKETGRESDRANVAGVFINRLRIGMRLQTDPTVIYGLGDKFDGNLRKKDLLTDQEYNTYTRSGLPPTPIALPGMASIRAALNPAKTSSLYFVAKGNGESHFSSNLTDHNRAVSKYQK